MPTAVGSTTSPMILVVRPFAAVLGALEDRLGRRPSWSRFWPPLRETSWKRLTRFHSLANDSFMLG